MAGREEGFGLRRGDKYPKEISYLKDAMLKGGAS